MKTPQQRGTFGAWLRDQRLAAGHENVPSAVKALQQAVGYGIAASVWAELEAGSRRPSKEQRDRLTMFFGSEPAESASDLGEVIAAIRELATAQREQAAAMDRLLQSSPGTLTITEPRGGAVVNEATVEVRGTAPANTEVVHDIPALPDERTLSDADGQWSMTVDLDVGDNVLTFRLGDDPFEDTEQQVLVKRER